MPGFRSESKKYCSNFPSASCADITPFRLSHSKVQREECIGQRESIKHLQNTQKCFDRSRQTESLTHHPSHKHGVARITNLNQILVKPKDLRRLSTHSAISRCLQFTHADVNYANKQHNRETEKKKRTKHQIHR